MFATRTMSGRTEDERAARDGGALRDAAAPRALVGGGGLDEDVLEDALDASSGRAEADWPATRPSAGGR